ncbi:MAG: hypothetical protein LBR52_02260 [Prevotellaceae bacterium]|nr:hypothetical protein [Prevotellaceae bacterium]
MHTASQPRSGLSFFGVGKEIAIAHPPSCASLARGYLTVTPSDLKSTGNLN